METKSLYTVYNQRLAGYLMQNGFPLLKLLENPDSHKNVFIFANNNMLHDCIDKWKISKITKE